MTTADTNTNPQAFWQRVDETFDALDAGTHDTSCAICGQPILPGERVNYSRDDETVEHASCTRDWYRRNFGAEGPC